MRRSWAQGAALCATVALAVTGCTSDGDPDTAGSSAEHPAPVECSADAQPISNELSSGATWTMCWGVDPDFGLTLTEVHITPPGEEPIRVIDTMSISQLEVPYDTGVRNTYDITEAGFGGRKMKTLDDQACVGDLLAAEIPNIGDGEYGESENREVLCSETVDAGLSYHSTDRLAPAVDRRTDWRIFTASRVGWYEYITQYTFGADGSISVDLGATGDLSPVDYTDEQHGWDVGDDEHAANHSHNAVWRIHWGLGGDGGMDVQQFDAEPTGEMGEEAPILEGTLSDIESPGLAEWQDRRWWRVLNPGVLNADEHPISYQIDLQKSDSFEFVDDQEQAHTHDGDIGYDVAFTNADACEMYASRNYGDCGRSVPEFVADGREQALDDVVSWVAVGYHHVPRDEEQSPMEMHWQGFTLLPRDLTAQRFDLPEGHEEVNGVPDEEWRAEHPDG